ncbi:MAG: O-antigen ligase family protein [Acidobacteriota bacterium]|nr:O-antigen ligase family protein [Acidobacteriota bacterium]
MTWCAGWPTTVTLATACERGSKVTVVLSVVGAAWLMVRSVFDWPALPWVSLAAFGGAWVAARWVREGAVRPWLLLVYIAPGLLTLGLGDFRQWDQIPWIAGLVGVMVATSDPTRWHLPRRWRAPLAAWGLVLAVSWPLIWLREYDFAPSVVWLSSAVNNRVGIPPDIANLWILGVVLTHGVGLLWLDWLCATFQRGVDSGFHRNVAVPLSIGCVLTVAVAVYQALFDRGFANAGHWAEMGRASGLLMDANPFGMAAAIWGPIGAALVLRRAGSPDRRPDVTLGLIALVVSASWYGLWVSGSRSALVAGMVAGVFVVRWVFFPVVKTRPRYGVALLAIILLGATFGAGSSTTGPWRRLSPMLPSANLESVQSFVREVWNRNGYGAAATRMVAEHPLVGVGVGAFHVVGPDVAYELGYGHIEPDNAQNWPRHQLAEFGLVGSIGWIVWGFSFLALLVRGQPLAGRAIPAGLLRGAVVALGVASQIGMPTQSIALALTFWTVVFWYSQLMEPSHGRAFWERGGDVTIWVVVWILALTHLGGQAYLARDDLRVPTRAQRSGWAYTYGFHAPEPDETGGEFRWAGRRGVAVVPVGGERVELSAWIHHPDVEDTPVDLRVWFDGELVIDEVRGNGDAVQTVVAPAFGQEFMAIETRVGRTWSPADYGEEDTRELGPGVRWRVVDR